MRLALLNRAVASLLVKSKPLLKVAAYELRPPLPQELPQAIKQGIQLVKSRKNFKNITVREAIINGVITTEVICWFFVGEWIGKGTLIGYQV